MQQNTNMSYAEKCFDIFKYNMLVCYRESSSLLLFRDLAVVTWASNLPWRGASPSVSIAMVVGCEGDGATAQPWANRPMRPVVLGVKPPYIGLGAKAGFKSCDLLCWTHFTIHDFSGTSEFALCLCLKNRGLTNAWHLSIHGWQVGLAQPGMLQLVKDCSMVIE